MRVHRENVTKHTRKKNKYENINNFSSYNVTKHTRHKENIFTKKQEVFADEFAKQGLTTSNRHYHTQRTAAKCLYTHMNSARQSRTAELLQFCNERSLLSFSCPGQNKSPCKLVAIQIVCVCEPKHEMSRGHGSS
jgi:hypothetical protein